MSTNAEGHRGMRGVRYDVAWSLPQTEFQVPGEISSWWIDSAHATEAQAQHRIRELDGLMSMFHGSIAIYRIDFNGREILSERMIAKFGKESSPPRRDRISMPSASAAEGFKQFKARWDAVKRPDPVPTRRPLNIRKRKKTKREPYAALAVCLILLCIAGMAVAAFKAFGPEPVTVAREAVPDPKRYDNAMMVVPASNGQCDQIAFNNRTGGSSYAGRKNCNEIEATRSRQASADRPNAATNGMKNFLNR